MAIRTISYLVKSDGISPNTEQQAGLQSEHAVTQLVFTLDGALYEVLLDEKNETDTLVYRFDCCDSMGGTVKTDTSKLTGSTVTFTVGENLTRSGGKARVYLVISCYNVADKTETELLSYPAKLRFENVPGSDNGEVRESLSTLTSAAKDAAERAAQSAAAAEEAQGKTETAKIAIEGGSTVIFDGNGTFGEMDIDFVVDTALSKASDNAIANKAVATKFESIENGISESAENTDKELSKREFLSRKVDSFDENLSEDAAKQQYPSVKCLKDMVHIVESGTSGIWSYRKWSDGTAECWCKSIFTFTTKLNTPISGLYTTAIDISIPAEIMETQFAGSICGWWYGSEWLTMNISDSNKLVVRVFGNCTFIDDNDGKYGLQIFVIGRWK